MRYCHTQKPAENKLIRHSSKQIKSQKS